ncbi:MAG TPA: expansin EXLX1 family cellulose-binding protein [Solimonas sp.]|nr:expansin EXLX1 family cellulose-binding protein [Solimonas sp.]
MRKRNQIHAAAATLTALLLCACGGGATPADSAGASGARALGEMQSGEGTFYADDGHGSCSFENPQERMVAAINDPQYAGSEACGMCAEVTGPRGKLVLRIVNRCPGCKAGDLDLSEEAFALIADKRDGRVPITWVPVACEVAGPIALHFKDGSSQWWLAVQVRNSRLPIRQVEMQTASGFVALARQPYNYFVNADAPGPGPYTLRITATDGQQLLEPGIALRPGRAVQGRDQFE